MFSTRSCEWRFGVFFPLGLESRDSLSQQSVSWSCRLEWISVDALVPWYDVHVGLVLWKLSLTKQSSNRVVKLRNLAERMLNFLTYNIIVSRFYLLRGRGSLRVAELGKYFSCSHCKVWASFWN